MTVNTITAAIKVLDVHEAADKTTDNPKIRALVSAYGIKYRIGYFAHHTIEAGAFDASIATLDGRPVPMLHEHDGYRAPIGDAYPSEDAEGLTIEGTFHLVSEGVPSDEVARLAASARSGALAEWSIGYIVIASRVDPEDEDHIFVTEAELVEVSLVVRGANPATKTLSMASANEILDRIAGDIATLDARINAAVTEALKPILAQMPETPKDSDTDLETDTEDTSGEAFESAIWARRLGFEL